MNAEQSDTVEAIESSLRRMTMSRHSRSTDSVTSQEAASQGSTTQAQHSIPHQDSSDSGMPPSEAGAPGPSNSLSTPSTSRPIASSTSDYTIGGAATHSQPRTLAASVSAAQTEVTQLRRVPPHQRLRHSKSWPEGDDQQERVGGSGSRPTTLVLANQRRSRTNDSDVASADSASDEDDDFSEYLLKHRIQSASRDEGHETRDFLFSIPLNTSLTASGEHSRDTHMSPPSSASSTSTNSPDSGTSRDAHVSFVTTHLSQVFVTDPHQSIQYTCTCSALPSAAALAHGSTDTLSPQEENTQDTVNKNTETASPSTEQTPIDPSQPCARCLRHNRSSPGAVGSGNERRYFRSQSCPSRPLATVGRATATVTSRGVPPPPAVTSTGARIRTHGSYPDR